MNSPKPDSSAEPRPIFPLNLDKASPEQLRDRVLLLEGELERHLKNEVYQAALQETAISLTAELDPDNLLEQIIQRSANLINAEHGFVYLLSQDESEMRARVGVGLFQRYVGWPCQKGEGLIGRVWAEGQMIEVPDYSAWEHRDSGMKEPVQAFAALPLRRGSQVIGVLALGRLAGNPVFDENDVMI